MASTKEYAMIAVASSLIIFIAKAIFTFNVSLYAGKQMLQNVMISDVNSSLVHVQSIPKLHPMS